MTARDLTRIARSPHRCESLIRLYGACCKRAFRGSSVFLACMPKSGSTFLYSAIAEATGFRVAYMGYAKRRSEQDLYLPRLIDGLGRNTVTQQHTRATDANLELFRAFGIRPVILTRNLYDVAVSARQHLAREGHQHFPALHATPRYDEMDPAEQSWFVIDLALPWYVQFYVSWYEAWRDERVPMLWLRYEDLVNDWQGGLARVLDFHGYTHTEDGLRSALDRAQGSSLVAARMNQGIIGRGMSELTKEQRARIRRLTHHYPDIDFAPVLDGDATAAVAARQSGQGCTKVECGHAPHPAR